MHETVCCFTIYFFDILVQLIRTLYTLESSLKRCVWCVSLLLRQTYSVQITAISCHSGCLEIKEVEPILLLVSLLPYKENWQEKP